MGLKQGDVAPDFTLQTQDEQDFTLSEQQGRILLAFYPGDETPVCTKQMCDYRDGLAEFDNLGVQVVGISHNDPPSHRRFRDRYGLPFLLLSDPQREVAGLYGCHGTLGTRRGVFLVDDEQIIQYQHVELLSFMRRKRDEVLVAIRAVP